MAKLSVCCHDHVSFLALSVVYYYLTTIIIYFYESRSMHRSLFVACLLLLQTLHGATPSCEAYYLDDKVMGHIRDCYRSRGIDITQLPSFYMKPDLCQWLGPSVTAAHATLTDARRMIFLSPHFYQELTKQVYGNKVSAESTKTLLHEMGHHKQNKANGMLDAIRDQLGFTIDDVKYEEAAADVFAYKHMRRNEILALNDSLKKTDTNLSFQLARAINYLLGEKRFQKILEAVDAADTYHLNFIESYKLRTFMAHHLCLSDPAQRISTRHHSPKKKSARKQKKR